MMIQIFQTGWLLADFGCVVDARCDVERDGRSSLSNALLATNGMMDAEHTGLSRAARTEMFL